MRRAEPIKPLRISSTPITHPHLSCHNSKPRNRSGRKSPTKHARPIIGSANFRRNSLSRPRSLTQGFSPFRALSGQNWGKLRLVPQLANGAWCGGLTLMSALPPISSASPPGADLPGGVAEGPLLTRSGPMGDEVYGHQAYRNSGITALGQRLAFCSWVPCNP